MPDPNTTEPEKKDDEPKKKETCGNDLGHGSGPCFFKCKLEKDHAGMHACVQGHSW